MNWDKLKPKTFLDWLLIASMVLVLYAKFGDQIGGITGPQEITAVIVEESSGAPLRSAAQVAAMNSPEVAAYMDTHKYPFFNRTDPDQKGAPQCVKAAWKQAEGIDHPVLVVYSKDGRVLHKAHIAGESDVLPVLKKLGGE
jgi:hypothetical protein